MLWGGKAIPNYDTSNNPFYIAVDSSATKLVLVNTVTRDMLDIAILKRNQPHDLIVPGSILLSQSEEESKTYDSQSLTIHFVTRQ